MTLSRPARAEVAEAATSAAPPWHRAPRTALSGIVTATVLTVIAGGLGPSVVTLTLGPRRSFLPPWYLPSGLVTPNEWLVSLLVWAAILVGALALLVGMRALEDGWQPNIRRLFGLGAGCSVATALVPPLTSADVLIYAAYGRLQAIGRDPYQITPAEVFRSQFDPVLKWTERPWQDTPSVYGPLASFAQLLANRWGGENMHDIVFWLQMFCLVPFLITCAVVVLLARGDPRRQARATLYTIANPVLIWAVVAAAHNDALSVMFGVFALALVRRSPFGAGLAIGLAGCVKITIGLWGVAMLWAYRREPRKAIALCAGAGLPMGLAYVVWEPTAFLQVLRNGSYVSVGSWAHPLYKLLDLFMTSQHAKVVVGAITYVGLVFIATILFRVLPWSAGPGVPAGVDPRSDTLTVALRTALVLSVAWLVTAMYTLSWYDLLAWMPLALLGATKLDRLLLLRVTPLSMAYVPGRALEFGAALDFTSSRIRDTISPIVQMSVLAGLVLWWRRPDRPELFPLKKDPARHR